ncbi:MAG: hypothetical protein JWQ77_2302 [Jatrophihabitans sp.]|nr:hypothetical protein [Jatrophihabitans sp.]
MTAVSVSPLPCARRSAACQMSSLTRTPCLGVFGAFGTREK